MKKLGYLFLLSLCVCCAVKKPTFDVKKFEAHKINGEVNYRLKDSTYIRQNEYSDSFEEEIYKPHNNFVNVRAFFKSGKIKVTGQRFFRFEMGIYNTYDESGKLIKQTNFDKNYPFTIYDLAKKLKKEFGFDILHSDGPCGISRGYENGYYYYVSIALGPPKADHRMLRVDAITGETISDRIEHYGMGPNY